MSKRKVAKDLGLERTQVLFRGQVRSLSKTGEIDLTNAEKRLLKDALFYRDESVHDLMNNESIRYEQSMA